MDQFCNWKKSCKFSCLLFQKNKEKNLYNVTMQYQSEELDIILNEFAALGWLTMADNEKNGNKKQ